MSIDVVDDCQSSTLIRQDREIDLRWQNNWLSSGHCHIELRCDRLPVTETGYRSCFVSGSFADEDDVRAFVSAWLDEVADGPAWGRYLSDSRQLKLF